MEPRRWTRRAYVTAPIVIDAVALIWSLTLPWTQTDFRLGAAIRALMAAAGAAILIVAGRAARGTGAADLREEEVLRLVASGRSNAGIAAQLVISRRTVDAHLRAIFVKLGVSSALEDNARVLVVRAWLARSRPLRMRRMSPR